jgi:hypothetical protein
MTPALREFLRRAANHPWHDILIGKRDRRVAAQAVAAGYGRATEAWFPLFVINEFGRAAVGDPFQLKPTAEQDVADIHNRECGADG